MLAGAFQGGISQAGSNASLNILGRRCSYSMLGLHPKGYKHLTFSSLQSS